MTLLLIAFCVAFMLTMGVVRLARTHAHLVNDHDQGPQKFHAQPVPRVGGLGIVSAVAVGALGLWWQDRGVGGTGLVLLGCAMPAFGAGLTEDVTKRVSPRQRLLFTAASAMLAAWLLDALIRRTDIPGLDWVVSFSVGAVLLTVLAVSGIANAVNLIDGFNGLSSMCVLMMLASLAFVGYAVDDHLVAVMALVGVGAVLGFFVWNYPGGKVFLGDGGAYFLGFYLAELAILLLARNPEVSPLFPLTLVIYPVFETVFSMYRRKLLQGRPVGMPDGAHLHSLIYRRLLRYGASGRSARDLTRRNSMTAPYLWVLCMLSIVPAVVWWDSSFMLAGCIVLFGVSYVTLYWRIVRFRAPRWMVLRRGRRAARAATGIIAGHDGTHANRGTGCRP
ncbi:MraY family glycosyltransferase [Azohydromonas aeria]|uniref:MraY family glycosyltransferase n=1 Tax=Azohydromonas aeria TaxID=2590212 RepID=UPI0012F7A6EC|nr:glycosyltransferase [Azohydromonas aeria]